MLRRALAFVEPALDAPDALQASLRFFDAAKSAGASYIQTRLYRRPSERLTSTTHWAAGGFVLRSAPQSWPNSGAFNYVCFECNPLLDAIRKSITRYRFSDFAPHGGTYGAYWEALSEANIAEGLCATSYGLDGTIASLHLGFATRDIGPERARVVQLAGLVLTERLIEFAHKGVEREPRLSQRERDCIAYVADGKTDWEISVILGVSETTARFHVDNARRKLGASNRAHAVARLTRRGVI